MNALGLRRTAAVAVAVGLLGVAAGCGQITQPTSLDAQLLGPVGTPAAVTAVALPHVSVNLSILTGKMLGKPGWPQYTPAEFTVPAHSLVTVTIRNFDSGQAQVPAAYLRVQGTVGGTIAVAHGVRGNVAVLPVTHLSAVAANDVAHTFTVPALGLNVPIPPASTVTFSFRTGAAGSYAWQCFAPCGTGPTGWSGAMAALGYMQGHITVQA